MLPVVSSSTSSSTETLSIDYTTLLFDAIVMLSSTLLVGPNDVLFSLLTHPRRPVKELVCISCWRGSMPSFKNVCVMFLLDGPSVTSSASRTCESPVTHLTPGSTLSLRCVTINLGNASRFWSCNRYALACFLTKIVFYFLSF